MTNINTSKRTVQTWIGLLVLIIVAGFAFWAMGYYAPKADSLIPVPHATKSCDTILINGRCPGVFNGAYDSLYVKVSQNHDCSADASICVPKTPRHFGINNAQQKYELHTLNSTLLKILDRFAASNLCAKISGVEIDQYYPASYKAIEVSGVDSGGNACSGSGYGQ